MEALSQPRNQDDPMPCFLLNMRVRLLVLYHDNKIQ